MKYITLLLCLAFSTIKAQKIRLDSIQTKQIDLENNKKVLSYGVKQVFRPKKNQLEITRYNHYGNFDSQKIIQYYNKNNTIHYYEQYYRNLNNKKWQKRYKVEYFYDKNDKNTIIESLFNNKKWQKNNKTERFREKERFYTIKYVYTDNNEWRKIDEEYFIENPKGKTTLYVSTSTDSLDTEWKQMIKKESFYEKDTILKEEILLAFDGNNWVNNQKTEYFFNNENNYSVIVSIFSNNEWTNDYKTIHTEDKNSNKIEKLYQVWNKKEQMWENYSLHEQKTDENEHSVTMNFYKINEVSKKMELNEREIHFYDDKKRNIEIQYFHNDGRGERITYTFDNNGNTTQEVQYIYQTNSKKWEEIEKYEYTYLTTANKEEVEDKGNIETETIISKNPLLNIKRYTKINQNFVLIRETNYFYSPIR
ncbi:MAG: hypothetical protein Q3983_03360 [Capnocytophaga sp.]|nr:hypothetical protein [Capnocytophaga sp.]